MTTSGSRPAIWVLLVIVLLLPHTPALTVIPFTDSGVFLYSGQQILAGKLPYRAVWDHKPPGIHLLNALALGLAGGSRWGVWLLEVVAVSAAVLVAESLLRRAFGRGPAWIALLLGLLALFILLQGGNLTEEYVLPLQWAALALAAPGEKSIRRAVLIGVLGGFAFTLRQNAIGVWLVIGTLWLVDGFRARDLAAAVRRMIVLVVGAFAVIGAVAFVFAAFGALDDLWDGAFRYNFAYVDVSPGQHVAGVIGGLLALIQVGLFGPVLVGWIAGVWTLQSDPHGETKMVSEDCIGEHLRVLPVAPRATCGCAAPGGHAGPPLHDLDLKLLLNQYLRFRLMWFAVIGLPVEIVMSSVSDQLFLHYYVLWLPFKMILIAGLVRAGWDGVVRGKPARRRLARVGLVLVIVLVAWPAWAAWADATIPKLARIIGGRDLDSQVLVDYVTNRVAPDESLLVWGADVGVNVATDRRAPTRFVYQYALFTPGYHTAEFAADLLRDLEDDPPALILDTSPTNAKTPPLDSETRAEFLSARSGETHWADLDGVFAWIAARYEFAGTVGPDGWRAYHRVSLH